MQDFQHYLISTYNVLFNQERYHIFSSLLIFADLYQKVLDKYSTFVSLNILSCTLFSILIEIIFSKNVHAPFLYISHTLIMSPFLTEVRFIMLPLFCFSYFTNISSFPQPLTAEEEKYYLERYQSGDDTAKNILIERNLRLVAHIVKKYSNIGNDMDDLISIGTIGLIKGITSFDPKKCTRLATYAARCIENEILMSIRAGRKQRYETSLHAPIGMDQEGNEISLLDILCTENDTIFDQVDLDIEVRKLYQHIRVALKPREKEILLLRYGLNNQEEKTQREIAEIMGISRSYVSRIEKKALKKLYKELQKKEA